MIDDFCRRNVMNETAGEIRISLPVFERWIVDVGVTKLIASTLADDLESELQSANEAAYVKAGEIAALIKDWPLYRGTKISAESIRSWLDQFDAAQNQRLAFKLLQHLRFVTPAQVAENLNIAHQRAVVKNTPVVRRETKSERRRDLLVTYLDGPAKSGAAYARVYAKEVGLLMESVVEPGKLSRRLTQDDRPSGVVIVDDFAGTGRSIADALSDFIVPLSEVLVKHDIPLFFVILISTAEAEGKIEAALAKYPDVRSHVFSCEQLDVGHSAFLHVDCGFWKDVEERDRAKAMCVRLGTGLYKDPLGYGSQGLLLAFPDTCPNNSLPILFASRAGANSWNALFPRPSS